ncbi:MAG: Fe-S cluster assembly protein SufD [Prevotellaceae bacterium]|jgi:Fe-S cluster assembly protein SufD|nr:Fe-S cluster assembly protein SufD [Prevotellaceae bacterium]
MIKNIDDNQNIIQSENLVDYFINIYLSNMDLICENTGEAMNLARREAIENFNINSIYNHENEKYKHINIRKIFSYAYEKYFVPTAFQKTSDIFICDVYDLVSYKIFLQNGFYCNKNEKLTILENGVVYGSLAEASIKYPELFKQYYNKISDNENEGLAALNTAFAQDGIFVYIPQNVVLDKPLQITNILLGESNTMVQHRNLFIVEQNAQANILICNNTFSDSKFLTNCVNETFAGNNAHLNVVRLQNEHNNSNHFSFSHIKQENGSYYTDNTITLNGGVVCNNINTLLAGEHCENHTFGLFLVDRSQYVANYTSVNHAAPHCTSNEHFKGILDDSATGIFKGKILVSSHADKTEAFQTNNNIMLSDSSRMFTRPQLEIYADDVKCSHGVTVGRLDEEVLFYMRSRGIEYRRAQLLQLFGFAYDVIRKINIEVLRNSVADLVEKRLRGELSQCIGCTYQCKK